MSAHLLFRFFSGSLVRIPTILLAVGLVLAGIGGMCRADSPVADLPGGMTLWPDLPTPPPTTTPRPTRVPALPTIPEWLPSGPVSPEASRARDLAVTPTPYSVSLDEVGVGSVPGVRFLAVDLWDRAGWSVSGAGDVNRDGYGDVLIGFAGKAALIYGGPNGPGYRGIYDLNDAGRDGASALLRHSSESVSIRGVSGVYDTNRDRRDDILLSIRPDYDSGSLRLLRLASILGWPELLGVVDIDACSSVTFVSQTPSYGDSLGYSICGAGDFNGDGWADALLSDPYVSHDSIYRAGEVYLLYGQANGIQPGNVTALDGTKGTRIRGDAERNAYLGVSVSGLGDVNGDGLDDFAVADRLGAWVLYGNPNGVGRDGLATLTDLPVSEATRVTGLPSAYDPDSANYETLRVAAAGDVNGDGLNDVLLSSPMAWGNGSVWLLYGRLGGFGTGGEVDLSKLSPEQGVRIDGLDFRPRLGIDVAGAGDVNGDGFDDILLGNSLGYPAFVYLIHGGPGGLGAAGDGIFHLGDINGANGLAFRGREENDRAGWSLSGAGDVNGDGLSDFLIGSPELGVFDDAYTLITWGEAYLIYGSDDPTTPTYSSHLSTRSFPDLHAIGRLGDGSDDGPASRCWVSLTADGEFVNLPTGWIVGGLPPTQSIKVDVSRFSGSFEATGIAHPLPIRWQVSAGGTSASWGRLRFHYLESELWGIDEASLQLYRSPDGKEPFQPIVTERDPGTNTLQSQERVPLAGVYAIGGDRLLTTPIPTLIPPPPTPTRTLPPTPEPTPSPCPTDGNPPYDAYAFEEEMIVQEGDSFVVDFYLKCNRGNSACWCLMGCYDIDFNPTMLISATGLCPGTYWTYSGTDSFFFQALRQGECTVRFVPGPSDCYSAFGNSASTRVIIQPAQTPFATITPHPYPPSDGNYDCYPTPVSAEPPLP